MTTYVLPYTPHPHAARFAVALVGLGLALLAAPAAQAQNLVTNPGFETGDYSGYTLTGDSSGSYISSPGYNSDFSAALTTSTANGFLSQTLNTKVGQTYNISFYLESDGATPNTFSLAFGGTTVSSVTNLSSVLVFNQYTAVATATSNSTPLTFTYRDDPGYFYLDNISVTPAPVPEASTTVSFGVLLALGLGGVVLARKRKAASTAT